MDQRHARGVRLFWAVLVAVAFASCGRATGGDGGDGTGGDGAGGDGASGEGQLAAAGESGKAGGDRRAGGRGGAGGSLSVGGSLSAGGALTVGGAPDDPSCAGQGNGWSSGPESCHACPTNAKVECDEIVAGASYDDPSCTLTLRLPPGRLEVASAYLGVTFWYVDHRPEGYAEVNGAVAGDTLTFDFSAYRGPGISYLFAEPAIKDTCGGYLTVHAPGSGFGPEIMIATEANQDEGGAASSSDIDCGLTN